VAVYDLGSGTFDVSVLEWWAEFSVSWPRTATRTLAGMISTRAYDDGVSRTAAEAIKEFSEPRVANFSGAVRIDLSSDHRANAAALSSIAARCGLRSEDLHEVILAGGATRMPLVRDFVKEIFGQPPNTSQHPDEAVAVGAAIQAGILDGAVRNVTLLDVTPLSLGIETWGAANVLIPRNTTIPCKAGEMFTNAAANQASMRMRSQGEREMAGTVEVGRI
jgi:molecular chaperone DnaK